MTTFLAFALTQPALVVVPLIGFVASLVIIRMKRRYIKEGTIFRRSPRPIRPAGQETDESTKLRARDDATSANSTRIRNEGDAKVDDEATSGPSDE